MEKVGLRELNQNPSNLVTDRGKPVFRMVPEIDQPTTRQRMRAAGEAQAPGELGIPDVVPDLAASIESLADLLLADRDRERRR
jgi:hypothetical protein